MISELLGQKLIIEKILFDKVNRSFLIRGETGQGKTHLVNSLIKNKKFAKYKLVDLSSSSGYLSNSDEYVPFIEFINNNEKIIDENLRNNVSNMMQLIPHVDKVIDMLKSIDSIVPTRFSNTEKFYLNKLEKIIKNRKTIFICEDIESWDLASLNFLAKIMDKNNQIALSHNAVFICTSSKPVSNIRFDLTFHLSKIKKSDMLIVTQELTTKVVKSDMINKLFRLSQGNIGIINKAMKYLDKTVVSKDFNTIYEIITDNLEKQSPLNFSEIHSILDHSSLIGISSQKMLLSKYTGLSDADFNESIKTLVSNEILKDNILSVKYQDSLVWQAFFDSNKDKLHFHLQLAETLKSIMPSNLEKIAEEFLLSSNEYEAAVFYALDYFDFLRKHHQIKSPTRQVNLLWKKLNLVDFVTKTTERYLRYFEDKYELEYFEVPYMDSRLRLELTYINVLNMTNDFSQSMYYNQAYQQLSQWTFDNDFKVAFPYLWLKSAILSLELSYELDFDSHKTIVKRIEQVMNMYMQHDIGFMNEHYRFISRSNIIYSVDTAYYHTVLAQEYFYKKYLKYMNVIDYYVSLVNVSANALVMGDFEHAIEYASKGLLLVEENSNINFSSVYALLNNMYISKVLFMQNHEMRYLIDIFESLIDNAHGDIASLLLNNNLAIILIYNGEFLEALDILEDLHKKIQFDDVDDYYVYLIESNYYIARWAIKNEPFAFESYIEIKKLIPLKNDYQYFKSRTEFIINKINNDYKIDFSVTKWNDFDTYKVGKAWNFWGKWLIFTDIQLWTD